LNKVRVLFLALSLAARAAIAQNTPTGIVKRGGVSLVRTEAMISVGTGPPVATLTETFGAGFQSSDYTNYTPPPAPQITVIDVCSVAAMSATPASTNTGVVVTPLDAGPALNLNGPNGMKQFPANKFLYGGILSMSGISFPGAPPPSPPYLVPGTYTVDNGAGGADIGPFTATMVIPDPLFAWTNADANLSIDRSAGIDIQWTGGDPNSKVVIQGVALSRDPVTLQPAGSGVFNCLVDNSAGHYFVSADVLTLLPPSPTTAPILPGTSTLTVGDGIQASFDAPGSDMSSFTLAVGGSRSVVYK
jgi:hypothetical protein